jgi:YidC/Oxa1 family membrane protein insertase
MFQTILIKPLYNIFIFLIGVVPHGDVGLAIIALTVLVRVIAYPAFSASIKTQMGMQAVQGEVDEINKKYKDNPEEKAKQTMELFKEKEIRPFAGFVALFVQIPIFIALYYAFFREGLPNINTALLYPFVHAPALVNVSFLGFLNLLAKNNILLAVAVAFLQYLVMHFSLARAPKPKSKVPNDREAAMRMQQNMMLYFLPTIMGVLSYTLIGAVGLYFATGSVFSLGQEWLIRKQHKGLYAPKAR